MGELIEQRIFLIINDYKVAPNLKPQFNEPLLTSIEISVLLNVNKPAHINHQVACNRFCHRAKN